MNEQLFDLVLVFILNLYSYPALPRKIVDVVVDFLNEFVCTILFSALKNDIFSILKSENLSLDARIKIDRCFQNYSKSFQLISSEDKRFSIFRARGMIDHENILIGKTFFEKISGNVTSLSLQPLHAAYVPLKKSIKCFLEIPGMFQSIQNYIAALNKEKGIVRNIMQSKLWREKYSIVVHGTINLPLFIWYDDLETGNALGSNAGKNLKFGAVYALLACLPPKIASRLNSIIFTMLFQTNSKKSLKNREVFDVLIEELHDLQKDGIEIVVNGIKKVIKIQLVLVLGDNLGVNSILGLVESFSANHFCRICRATLEQTKSLTIEDPTLLRNEKNYEEDVHKGNPTETGIKELCAFHKVYGFHLTQNVSADVMHDVLEGTCIYVLQALIKYYVYVKKYFTLEELNDRITNFDFGSTISNKPPKITEHRLKENNLNLSASEAWSLVRFFGVIIGEKIPRVDKYWQLYIYMRDIVDILMSPRITESLIKSLEIKIELHNELYRELCKTLQPKFHILCHYPFIMRLCGPIVNLWSMRFEGLNVKIKKNVQSTSNKKNVLATVAIKQTLGMFAFTHNFLHEPRMKLFSKDEPEQFVELEAHENVEFYKKIEVDDVMYRLGSVFVLDSVDDTSILLTFGKIIKIIKTGNDIIFNFDRYEEIAFDDHFYAYRVRPIMNEPIFVDLKNLQEIPECTFIESTKGLFIVPKYKL